VALCIRQLPSSEILPSLPHLPRDKGEPITDCFSREKIGPFDDWTVNLRFARGQGCGRATVALGVSQSDQPPRRTQNYRQLRLQSA